MYDIISLIIRWWCSKVASGYFWHWRSKWFKNLGFMVSEYALSNAYKKSKKKFWWVLRKL